MLLICCSLFLPLVCFPVILPSRTSRNNTSCRRTCPSHLRFRCFIVLMIQRVSLTRFRTTELLTFAVQPIFSIFDRGFKGCATAWAVVISSSLSAASDYSVTVVLMVNSCVITVAVSVSFYSGLRHAQLHCFC